jgi:2-amino-4-hydroxy-6-hydroxymethyldihydropteridine diphosphokinase
VTETPNPNIVDTDTLTGEMHPIRRSVLALGSNLGERLASLQGAVDSLADTPEVWVTAVSPVYETRPVDAPEGSKDFLNAVVLIDTTLSARTLLDRALAIEDAFGRERTGERGAPRTLDVDLIVVGDRRANDEELVLPHPKAHERAFVLAPWVDVEPDAEFPDRGPVAELLEKSGREGVIRRDDVTLNLQ